MRTLTLTLTAAQQAADHVPYVKVEAVNKSGGAVRLDWTRLYTGAEEDYYHAVTMPSDGSLIRVRITPPSDGRKLYRQRVASPGAGSEFSSWTYTNQYNCLAVAAASNGAEVSIFWINDSREVRRIASADYGASWGSAELLDYSPSAQTGGIAAAYKPNGDLAIFFADQTTLYMKKRIGGSWQSKSAWDKSTGNLSGAAVDYDSDWNLVVSGQDAAGNYKLWNLVHGDGGDVSSGSWSALQEIASASSDSNFTYGSVFLDKPDVHRCFYTESFSGTEAYHRPFWSNIVPDGKFVDNQWREPAPFNVSAEYGLAIAHHGDYCWLSAPYGVWRASLAETRLDLSANVISLKQETGTEQGMAVIELRNDDGRYASLPPPLETGCQIEISPGYVTSQGNEVSPGQTFTLAGYEYTSAGGKASLLLYAQDGWESIGRWQARHQFRWNRSSDEMSVKQILTFVLARAGLKLETISQSAAVTGFYPDFAIHAASGDAGIVKSLLSFVPDVLFIEGGKAYLVNPLPSDSSVYSYGQGHAVLAGGYRLGPWAVNRAQVEGYDPSAAAPVIVDSFEWNQIDRLRDRLSRIRDSNITSVEEAGQRGQAHLRQAEIASGGGFIRVPVNCGQQLYDVIDITDARAGLSAAKRRVIGISLIHNPARGEYEQRLKLGMA